MDNAYVLKTPVTVEGEEIKDVVLSRMKGSDLIAVEREMKARGASDAGEMEKTLYLLARSTGLAVEVFEEMDTGDITALSGKAANLGFF